MSVTQKSLAPQVARGVVALAETDGTRTVVWLRGEHDVATVGALSDVVARAIALGAPELVLDLSGVEFMSAATVSIIIRTREFLRQRSRSLTLRSPSPSAHRILDLCGVAELLGLPAEGGAATAVVNGALASWVSVPTTAPRPKGS